MSLYLGKNILKYSFNGNFWSYFIFFLLIIRNTIANFFFLYNKNTWLKNPVRVSAHFRTTSQTVLPTVLSAWDYLASNLKNVIFKIETVISINYLSLGGTWGWETRPSLLSFKFVFPGKLDLSLTMIHRTQWEQPKVISILMQKALDNLWSNFVSLVVFVYTDYKMSVACLSGTLYGLTSEKVLRSETAIHMVLMMTVDTLQSV